MRDVLQKVRLRAMTQKDTIKGISMLRVAMLTTAVTPSQRSPVQRSQPQKLQMKFPVKSMRANAQTTRQYTTPQRSL